MVNPELDCIFHLFVNDLSTPDHITDAIILSSRAVHTAAARGTCLARQVFCVKRGTFDLKVPTLVALLPSHMQKSNTSAASPHASSAATRAQLHVRHQTCMSGCAAATNNCGTVNRKFISTIYVGRGDASTDSAAHQISIFLE